MSSEKPATSMTLKKWENKSVGGALLYALLGTYFFRIFNPSLKNTSLHMLGFVNVSNR